MLELQACSSNQQVITVHKALSYVSGCPGVEGYAQSLKGNNLPGSTDESYGISITQDFNSDNGVTSARLSYRYRGEADLSIFNMDRLKIDAQVTMDLLIRYTPNSDDWYRRYLC